MLPSRHAQEWSESECVRWTDGLCIRTRPCVAAGLQVMSIDDKGKPSLLPDRLDDVKFSSIAWTHDNRGFFYNRWAEYFAVATKIGAATASFCARLSRLSMPEVY